MNLKQRFDAFDTNLNLNSTQRDRAIKVHNDLDQVLRETGVAKKTRLQGSFARKTMLPPLKDVDKIIELSGDLANDVDGVAGGSRDAMEQIQQAVTEEYPGATFEFKRHALGISLPGEDFEFDAVPAINDDDTEAGTVRIANTEDDCWNDSNTYTLIDVIQTRNQETNGVFIHAVRMVKHLFRQAGIDKIPGLHIEAFCFDAVDSEMSYPDAIVASLKSAVAMLADDYYDPTGQDRISDRIEPAIRSDAQTVIATKLDTAETAKRAADGGDDDTAAELWAELLGDEFPRPEDAAEKAAELKSLVALNRTHPTRAWKAR